MTSKNIDWQSKHASAAGSSIAEIGRAIRSSGLSLREIERRSGLCYSTIAKLRDGERTNSLLSTYLMLQRALS